VARHAEARRREARQVAGALVDVEHALAHVAAEVVVVLAPRRLVARVTTWISPASTSAFRLR